MIINRQQPEQMVSYFNMLRNEIDSCSYTETLFISIGTTVVRIENHSPELSRHIRIMFGCSITKETEHYETTIVMWKTSFQVKEEKVIRLLMDERFSKDEPAVIIDDLKQKIEAYDATANTYYFGIADTLPEELATEGHLAVKFIYRIMKKPGTSLIHGACVGHNGKGILLCARGNRGKSTLTVLAMLMGMEYVSDDYMLLTDEGGKLFTDPIYSIITLSPKMYNEMYDELADCRFVSNNWNKTKYILDISSHHDKFRYHYPIEMCIFPEIVDDEEPSIVPCSVADKGRAITHLVHSTTSQMIDQHDAKNTVKLMQMLKTQSFYRFNLCHDIRKNVVFLREFLSK